MLLPFNRIWGKRKPDGNTYEEAVGNLKDAIRLHIEARREVSEPIPIEAVIDEVEVNV